MKEIHTGYSSIEFEMENIESSDQIARTITTIPAIESGQAEIVLPTVPEGYKVTLYGSDRLPVIDKAGAIHTPLVDTEVKLLFRVENLHGQDQAISDNVTVLVPGQHAQTEDLNMEPSVIPSLREWLGRTGDFVLTNRSKIIVNPLDRESLQQTAITLQNDLSEIGGFHLDIEFGHPQAGDLYLSLDESIASLGQEGYILDIDDYVSLKSAAATGAFYGTRSVLQILKQAEGNDKIPKGTARDYPKYEIRGLMIDVARKFYTIDFLRDYVKLLSWYKMNQFQIHLNDDVGTPFADGTYTAFRLESTTYPGLASATGHYTKDEFRELQRLGMAYGVNVIPEIDTPGHSRSFVDYNPSLGTKGNLDITRPETVQFVKSLFDEYLDGDNPTFIGPDVHIGTDEYWGDTERFRWYMDEMIRYIDAKGKHPQLWGGLREYDGATPISTAATMNIWHEPYGDAQQAVDAGFDIINTENSYLYLVPRLFREYVDPQLMYHQWEPNIWTSSSLPSGHPKLRGAMLALWNDISDSVGVSMHDTHNRMFPAVQIVAEKTWTGTRIDRAFDEYAKSSTVTGDAPGTDLTFQVKTVNGGGMVLRYSFDGGFADSSGNRYDGTGTNVSISEGATGQGVRLHGGESYVETPLHSLGFGWTLSLRIKPDAGNPDDAVLLESPPAGRLKLRQGKSGKLGFTKEHYDSTFDYEVPAGVWTDLLLIGDHQGVSLYVNDGEYVEHLVAALTRPKLHTMILPLARIGSKTNAFKGVIDSVIVYNHAADVLEGANLALGRPVQTSETGDPQYAPELAVDGNLLNRWSSANVDDAWFVVDLGEPKEVAKVVFRFGDAFPSKYRIYVSSDGQTWTNVLADDGVIECRGGVITTTFAPRFVRYVKYQGIERGTEYGSCTKFGTSIHEFDIYGPERLSVYLKKAGQAEDLLASGRGDAGTRSRLSELLGEFPHVNDRSVGALERLIAELKDSMD